MNLLQLQVFLSLAETENTSQSAELLHIAQPAISSSLSKLETELGVRLFDRVKNRIYLNNCGRAYYETVQRALFMLDETSAAIRAASSVRTLSGELTIVGFSTPAPLLSCVCAFLHVNPEVTVHLQTGSPSLLTFSCASADFVFCSRPHMPELKNHQAISLMDYERVLAVPAAHRLSGGDAVRLTDLRNEDWVFCSIIPPKMESSYYHCIANGLIPRVRVISNNAAFKMEMIATGAGIGIVPKVDANAFAGYKGIRFLPFAPAMKSSAFYLCWDDRKPISDVAVQFLSHVRSSFGITEE